MKFKLKGKIWYAVGSCRDDRSSTIDEDINAENIESAITKAKKMVKILYKHYGGYTDFGMAAKLQAIETQGNKTIIETVWETHFVDEQLAKPAQPAIPAKPEKPAVPAHFEEKRLS